MILDLDSRALAYSMVANVRHFSSNCVQEHNCANFRAMALTVQYPYTPARPLLIDSGHISYIVARVLLILNASECDNI